MADKDSWWRDTTRGNSDKKPVPAPFPTRDTQNNGSKNDSKRVEESFKPRYEKFKEK